MNIKRSSFVVLQKDIHVGLLVYIEEFNNVREAIHREKSIKKWNRSWKLDLIEEQNPNWIDLYKDII